MTLRLSCIALIPALMLAGETQTSFSIRQKEQPITVLTADSSRRDRAVLFLPGDGGWRGAAISIGQAISGWGYDVYGFDTKHYLEAFTGKSSSLTSDGMRRDLSEVVAWIRSRGARSVIAVGWSQGAGMAVIAALNKGGGVDGVVTLGLPERAALGWNWKDTLASIARREPDEPSFQVKELLPGVAPTPVWMIHGTLDEYTPADTARDMYEAVREPKRLVEIEGANHRFDGRRAELYQALREGLEWIARHH
jgi:pimeloyl-ACP methyl ester carboxylesterase